MKRMILILSLLISFVGLSMANDIVGTVTSVTRSSDAISNITINGITQSVTWVDLPVASSYCIYNALISTTAAISTVAVAGITNPAVPRNIVAMLTYNMDETGITSHTVTGGRMVVEGKNQRGEDVSETMLFNSNSTQGLLNAGIMYSTNCYSSISKMTLTATGFSWHVSANNTTPRWVVGTGNRIGIPGDFNAVSDIITCNEAGTRTTTFVANPIYDYIDFVTNAPSGSANDYMVYFRNRNVPYR